MSWGGKHTAEEAVSEGRLIDDYLSELAYRRRASANTVDAYRNDLRCLQDFLHKERKTGLSKSMRDDILAFLVFNEGKEETARTRARRLSAVRGFFSFLKRIGRICESPVAGLKGAKIPELLPKVLNREEMELLLDTGRAGDKIQRRTGMILELMYATGIRVSEAIKLRMENILKEEGVILIEGGKGGKSRVVLMPSQTSDRLDEYIRNVRPLILDGGYAPWVFPTSRGNPIDRQAAWRDLKKLGKLAGIKTPIYPHLLRHTCATHLLENGCDLMTVQLLLGHANIATTEIYTHVLEERKRKAFVSSHPRAN